MSKSIQISGLIRLTTPLHFAGYESNKLNNDNKISSDGKPLTRTQTMNVIGVDGALVRDIPYVSGNSFRGSLRRHATQIVLKAIAKKGQLLTLDTFHGMTCGAVVGVPDSAAPTIGGMNKARSNLFMGLFGGGPLIQPSGYSVSDLYPVVKALVDIGTVPEGIAEEPYRVTYGENGAERGRHINTAFDGLTHFYHLVRIDDVMTYVDAKTMEGILNYDKEATQWLLDVMIESAEKKDATALAAKLKSEGIYANQAAAGKSRLKVVNMAALEAIVAGTPMYFDLNISDAMNDAQIGLMLLSLESLVQENALGGKGSAGMGKFDASALSITVNDEQHQLFVREGNKLVLDGSNQFIQESVTAAINALLALTADDMNSFYYRPAPPPAKKLAKESATSNEVADASA